MRLRFAVLATALIAMLSVLVPAASATPPSYLCHRGTLGTVVWESGKQYRCSRYTTWVSGQPRDTYYWKFEGYVFSVIVSG